VNKNAGRGADRGAGQGAGRGTVRGTGRDVGRGTNRGTGRDVGRGTGQGDGRGAGRGAGQGDGRGAGLGTGRGTRSERATTTPTVEETNTKHKGLNGTYWKVPNTKRQSTTIFEIVDDDATMVYRTDVDSENEFTLSDTVRDNKKRKVKASKSDMTRDSKSSTLSTEHPSSSSSSSSTQARSTVESTTEYRGTCRNSNNTGSSFFHHQHLE